MAEFGKMEISWERGAQHICILFLFRKPWHIQHFSFNRTVPQEMKDRFIFDICCIIVLDILSLYYLTSIRSPPWICLVVNQAVAQVAFLWVLLKGSWCPKCRNVQMVLIFYLSCEVHKVHKDQKIPMVKNVHTSSCKLCSWCCSGSFPSSPFFALSFSDISWKELIWCKHCKFCPISPFLSFQKHYHEFSNNSLVLKSSLVNFNDLTLARQRELLTRHWTASDLLGWCDRDSCRWSWLLLWSWSKFSRCQ